MFNFDEQGYHEYRATQPPGSDNKEGWSIGWMIIGSLVALSLWGFLALFIGCFLLALWSR